MFSFVINNPNKFVIVKDNYHVIPFGHCCASALACKYASIRKFSLPFDWVFPLFPRKIKNILENNFDDFIPDVYNNIFDNKYDIWLAHFNRDINAGVEEYKRRIDRFNDIINKPTKIYFVYINENYLFDKNYREDKFNDDIFNDFLEIENFIKNKYINIDYNILYFNFKRHDIPVNSNIINIVLHTDKLYNTDCISSMQKLRIFCGEILVSLFNTELKTGYDNNTFIG